MNYKQLFTKFYIPHNVRNIINPCYNLYDKNIFDFIENQKIYNIELYSSENYYYKKYELNNKYVITFPCNNNYKSLVDDISNSNKCIGGIIVLPLMSFMMSYDKPNEKLRNNFFYRYIIQNMNIQKDIIINNNKTYISMQFINKNI
jgi:hypothetical protein